MCQQRPVEQLNQLVQHLVLIKGQLLTTTDTIFEMDKENVVCKHFLEANLESVAAIADAADEWSKLLDTLVTVYGVEISPETEAKLEAHDKSVERTAKAVLRHNKR